MKLRRKLLLYLLMLSFVVFLMICLTELSARYMFRYHVSLVRNVDHRLQPNTSEHNSDGIRCEYEAKDFSRESFNMIFLGDSFVYGVKNHPQFAFPQQFESLSKEEHPEVVTRVANFGWTSSSPYLSLRLLKDIGAKYKPDVVFLCIDMSDFHDDLVYRNFIERPKLIYRVLSVLPGCVILAEKVFGKLAEGGTLTECYESVFGLPADRYFPVNAPLERTRAYCEPMIASIGETYAYVTDELKARFIVVILPRSFQYSGRECPSHWEEHEYEVFGPYVNEPFKLFDELKLTVDYPIYSLLEDFRKTPIFPTCFYDDPHWNEAGNRIAAQGIANIAKAERLFEECALNEDIQPAPRPAFK